MLLFGAAAVARRRGVRGSRPQAVRERVRRLGLEVPVREPHAVGGRRAAGRVRAHRVALCHRSVRPDARTGARARRGAQTRRGGARGAGERRRARRRRRGGGRAAGRPPARRQRSR